MLLAAAPAVLMLTVAGAPGRTGFGAISAEVPAGLPLTFKVTGAAKPRSVVVATLNVAVAGAQTACGVLVTLRLKSGASPEQTGRVPQAMPWALNASQMRQA